MLTIVMPEPPPAPLLDAVSPWRPSDQAGQKNEGGLKPLLVKTEGG